MAKSGRPKAVIDWKKVGGYLQAHCEGTTIASLLGIANDTLYSRCVEDNNMTFSELSQLKRAEGVTIIEYSLFRDAAQKGGIDRIFWLKNKAGWKDRAELDVSGAVKLEPFMALMKAASADREQEALEEGKTDRRLKRARSPKYLPPPDTTGTTRKKKLNNIK